MNTNFFSRAEPVTWTAAPSASFEDALVADDSVFHAVADALPALPHRDIRRHYPSTMADAMALVHAKEDAKKKHQAAGKAARKGAPAAVAIAAAAAGGGLPRAEHFPGAVEGAGDTSAFWLCMQDYYRDLTQEDLRDLLALAKPPRIDPAFQVPPLGPHPDDLIRAQQVAGLGLNDGAFARPAALPPPPPPLPPPPPPPRVQVQALAQADADALAEVGHSCSFQGI
jgi:hypothetical protein